MVRCFFDYIGHLLMINVEPLAYDLFIINVCYPYITPVLKILN